MDNLTEAFDSSFKVSFDQYNIYNKHPRFSMYKEKFSKSRQEERRKELLQEQKEKKIRVMNVKRGIVEKGVVEEIEKELTECVNTMPRYPRSYRDVLMLSEWLIDIPDDFYDKWFVVPCPVGKRVLVVAEKGTTMAYARRGFKILHRFASGLPGGSNGSNRNCAARLDCIWSEATRTLYVVDALELGPNLVDCECNFRFTWLEWKFNEFGEEIAVPSRMNKFRIVLLDRFRASELKHFVKLPLDPDVQTDGFMFFHEEGLYEEFNKSPLVTWLKPYMISDMFNLETHPDYNKDKPQQMETETAVDDTEPCEVDDGSSSETKS